MTLRLVVQNRSYGPAEAPGDDLRPWDVEHSTRRVRAFLAEDYVTLHNALLRAGLPRWVEHPRLVGEAYETGGPAFTALDADGTILGCLGITPIWTGRATSWAVLSPRLFAEKGDRSPLALAARDAARWLHYRVRHWLPALMEAHWLRRLEADVAVTNPNGVRWVKRLGFTLEAKSEGFGTRGETCYRYAMVRPLDAR